jgi:hypothetical protein
MERNFRHLNAFPFLPNLVCVKNTGPLESNLMIRAKMGNIQERRKTMTSDEIKRSKRRLYIMILLEFG